MAESLGVETGVVDQDDFMSRALSSFDLCRDTDSENRDLQEEDLRFVWLREQWPREVMEKRQREGRPCLTLDKTQAFVRQVVNDARMNKPAIAVKPVDSGADPETAKILGGLIKNIEYSSDADVAYDTAMDYAVSSGRGYFGINVQYATDDTFDQDIVFERKADPLLIWGDPRSTAADSSDWMEAWELEYLSKDEYERTYPGKDVVEWSNFEGMDDPWWDGDRVTIAKWWVRELIEAEALMLSDNQVVDTEAWEMNAEDYAALGIEVIARRPIKKYKVKCYILSGKQLLETIDWPGSYIPIIPVYGSEITVDGRRRFSSLTRPAFDAQRNYNYWRSTSTELVALAPKVPFIGKERAFNGEDAHKWATANSESWAYISVPDNAEIPQRQQMPSIPAGAMQEALNASDDMKAITGMHDASLGARSNETSGVAINARKQEGDVSTFHFIDNLSRAIKHAGRILVDLIPKIYNTSRIIRTLGPEGEPETVPIAPADQQQAMMQQMMMQQAQEGNEELAETLRIYDLSRGKYDVAVETGPSFTTQREEARMAFTELLRAAPQYADIIGPFLLKSFDFPGAAELLEKVEERIQAAEAQQAQGGQPQVDPAQMAEIQMKQQEQALKAQESQARFQLEQQKLELDSFKATTDRMKVEIDAMKPTDAPRPYQPAY
jgi:hypothetical protein